MTTMDKRNFRVMLLGTLLMIFMLPACVSTSEFNRVKGKLNECEDSQLLLKQKLQDMEAQANEAGAKADRLEAEMKKMKGDKTSLEDERDNLDREVKRLQDTNSDLEKQISAVKSGSSEEISRLLTNLESARADLEAREKKLAEKNQRLQQLEDLLARKDRAVKQLKQKMLDALTGYKKLGIDVTEKNGQVYVSMAEKLLFQSGKYNVGQQGRQALRKIAQVLAANPDINVLVEGHTDDVPLRGTGAIKDNWDLSVMRATAVTKILLQDAHINPKRITAAGRSKYLPVDPRKTPEARRKNRRTEIILTPDLTELYKLLSN
jgi:chemotaxis protein MotB